MKIRKQLLVLFLSLAIFCTIYTPALASDKKYIPSPKYAVELQLDKPQNVTFRYADTAEFKKNAEFVKFTPKESGFYMIKMNIAGVDSNSFFKSNEFETSLYDNYYSANDYASYNENPDTAELQGVCGFGNGRDYCVEHLDVNKTYYVFIKIPSNKDCSDLEVSLTVSNHNHSNVFTKTYKADFSNNGSIVKKCEVCYADVDKAVIIPKATCKISTIYYNYDGKSHTPAVTVKNTAGKALVRNKDYTLTYSKNRTSVGKYSVKITLIGNYTGSKTLNFYIRPKGTTIIKLIPTGKGFKVYWKKQTTQTTGYQIRYSTKSNMENAKVETFNNNRRVGRGVTKRLPKKKYYVQVRTYKNVKYNGRSTNVYSVWSNAKIVTTKK